MRVPSLLSRFSRFFGPGGIMIPGAMLMAANFEGAARSETAGANVMACDFTTPSAVLAGPGEGPSRRYGQSVAIDGDLAIVGDDGEGAAYIFNAASGALVSALKNPYPSVGDEFGRAVGISGNLALVGAPGEDPGRIKGAGVAYVFNAATGQAVWIFSNPEPSARCEFGSALGISGGLAAVGAPNADPGGVEDAGAAFVYDASAGKLTARMTDPLPEPHGNFGSAIAISGGRILVGKTGGQGTGSAHLFNAATGELASSLNDPYPEVGGWFGQSVAISGETALVGAYGTDRGEFTRAGAVHVYNAATGELRFTLYDPVARSHSFGRSLAICGNFAVAGSHADLTDRPSYRGAAHVFNVSTGTPVATMNSPEPSERDSFGCSVGISGDAVVVGAYAGNFRENFDKFETAYGVAYLFGRRSH